MTSQGAFRLLLCLVFLTNTAQQRNSQQSVCQCEVASFGKKDPMTGPIAAQFPLVASNPQKFMQNYKFGTAA